MIEEKESMSLDQDVISTIILVSSDNVEMTVPTKIAKMSKLVETMMEGDSDEQKIPLPNVKSNVLQKVIKFLTYHNINPCQEIEKPLKSANMIDNVCPFDAEFIDLEQEFLFELILCANYMDIKSLLDLSCAKVASMLKNKTPEEIRKTFNIVNDFTPEDEQILQNENAWVNES